MPGGAGGLKPPGIGGAPPVGAPPESLGFSTMGADLSLICVTFLSRAPFSMSPKSAPCAALRQHTVPTPRTPKSSPRTLLSQSVNVLFLSLPSQPVSRVGCLAVASVEAEVDLLEVRHTTSAFSMQLSHTSCCSRHGRRRWWRRWSRHGCALCPVVGVLWICPTVQVRLGFIVRVRQVAQCM